MPGGNVGNGVIVDLSTGFSDLVIDPHTRTIQAGASVTWAEVNDAAQQYGLRLPPDPSSGAFAKLSGCNFQLICKNFCSRISISIHNLRGRPKIAK